MSYRTSCQAAGDAGFPDIVPSARPAARRDGGVLVGGTDGGLLVAAGDAILLRRAVERDRRHGSMAHERRRGHSQSLLQG